MATLQDGVRNALENCVKLRNGERVVIITDAETTFVAQINLFSDD